MVNENHKSCITQKLCVSVFFLMQALVSPCNRLYYEKVIHVFKFQLSFVSKIQAQIMNIKSEWFPHDMFGIWILSDRKKRLENNISTWSRLTQKKNICIQAEAYICFNINYYSYDIRGVGAFLPFSSVRLKSRNRYLTRLCM